MKKVTELTDEQYTTVAKMAGLQDGDLRFHGHQLLTHWMYSSRGSVRPIVWLQIFDYLRSIDVEISTAQDF